MLGAADLVGGPRNLHGPDYVDQFESAVGSSDGSGFADEVKGNGVFALTNQRFLFFKKAMSVGTPKTITAEIAVSELVSAGYSAPMLRIELLDGSLVGLHVPRNQKPEAFAAAVERVVAS